MPKCMQIRLKNIRASHISKQLVAVAATDVIVVIFFVVVVVAVSQIKMLVQIALFSPNKNAN